MAGTHPWQNTFRSIPPKIKTKVQQLGPQDLIVSVAKQIPRDDIRNGVYAHLGVVESNGQVVIQASSVLPQASSGRASRTNREGEVKIRRDLPIETKYNAVDSPNWGDWSRGSHTNYLPYKQYPRDLIPPRELTISLELVTSSDDAALVKFTVDHVMNPGSGDFNAELLYCVNLLQENAGAIDIVPSNAALTDYLATVSVDWELLPPGERDDTLQRVAANLNVTDPDQRRRLQERLDVLMAEGPTNIITGYSGFRRYLGAQFASDFVVFENLEYGNAIYLMYEDWPTLSQKSRLELLAGPRSGFDRIEHRGGWQARLRGAIRMRLSPP